MPPAPTRFSTTTGWPSAFDSGSATMRAAMSVPPPAPKPTMMRIGRVGQSCACEWVRSDGKGDERERNRNADQPCHAMPSLYVMRGYRFVDATAFCRASMCIASRQCKSPDSRREGGASPLLPGDDGRSYFSSSIGLTSTPTPSMSISQVSPPFMNIGGLRAKPTPDGVPVMMMSPGSSVMPWVM